ncbi:MAG: cytochrome c [Desulfuromonadales bacterium]|nr:cytochrome c [Desulfuromonadales bacterium]
MRKSCVKIILSLMMGSLTISGIAFAHGKEKHGKKVPVDARMKKLHAMMPMFSIASAELESALEKGDAAAAKVQADKILAEVLDLKRSKPHKNIKQRKRFVGLATELEQTVIATVDLAKTGNFSEAKTAFKKVEETCAACHAKFRD